MFDGIYMDHIYEYNTEGGVKYLDSPKNDQNSKTGSSKQHNYGKQRVVGDLAPREPTFPATAWID